MSVGIDFRATPGEGVPLEPGQIAALYALRQVPGLMIATYDALDAKQGQVQVQAGDGRLWLIDSDGTVHKATG